MSCRIIKFNSTKNLTETQIQKALYNLTPIGFKFLMYLHSKSLSNQELDMSQKIACGIMNISIGSYQRGFKELIENLYLIEIAPNTYQFNVK